MSGFQRTNLLQPWATRSDDDHWMTRIVPEADYSHSVMIDPTQPDWNPQASPYRVAPAQQPVGFDDTGFAGFLRDYYLPRR